MKSRHEYFPALLKFWRGQRGFSQLDLSVLANVSSRHLSFLETGRSAPSAEMVLSLCEALDVPLRSRNEMLRAANFDARYPEPSVTTVIDEHLKFAIDAMLSHHEPYPMVIFDRTYDYFQGNVAGSKLIDMLQLGSNENNLLKLLFREQAQYLIENWEQFASAALRRLQRELLYFANDASLRQLLDELLNMPNVPENWRQLNLNNISEPLETVHINADGQRLAFSMAVTKFDAPQNVTINELSIESWFPRDESTREFCNQHLRSNDVEKK